MITGRGAKIRQVPRITGSAEGVYTEAWGIAWTPPFEQVWGAVKVPLNLELQGIMRSAYR